MHPNTLDQSLHTPHNSSVFIIGINIILLITSMNIIITIIPQMEVREICSVKVSWATTTQLNQMWLTAIDLEKHCASKKKDVETTHLVLVKLVMAVEVMISKTVMLVMVMLMLMIV